MTTIFLNYDKESGVLWPAGDDDESLLEHVADNGGPLMLETFHAKVKPMIEAHGWEFRIGGMTEAEQSPTKTPP